MRPRWWIAAYGAVVALFALAHLSTEPYDDSHFFKRVALHALSGGALSWNVDEGPVYGSTSQLFQGLALPATALAGPYYMIATRVLAALCLVAAFAALLRLSVRIDGGVVASIAFSTPAVLYPVLSGMETALVFALLATWLLVLYGERAERWSWALAPGLVVLVYLTRPDALLLAVPPLLIERRARAGRWPWREFALIALALAACLAGFRLYYGTALPLPFYAKHAAFSPYDAHFLALSRQVRSMRFGLFLAFATPPLLLALARRDRTNVVLSGSVAAFCAYHFWFTIEVMGMHGRFYAPAMPLLAFAGARGLSELARRGARRLGIAIAGTFLALLGVLWAFGWLPKQSGYRLERADLALYLLLVPAVAIACIVATSRVRQATAAALVLAAAGCAAATRLRADSFHLYSDEEYLALQTARSTVYRGLDTLRACFGESIHVYHSEVGLPGLRFLSGKVTDLAGLLSPEWLFQPRGFDAKCARDQPEAIFLPHKNYRDLNREILQGTCLTGYARIVESSSSPLYVRADLYPRFLACASARKDPYATK